MLGVLVVLHVAFGVGYNASKLFEHRAVILADAGIHRAVEAPTWTRLVDDLVRGIRAGRAAQAMVDVVGECGEILARGGVERRIDDVNELADAPRVRDR